MAIKVGNKVVLEYEGKFEDGKLFDSSSHGDHSHPLEVVIGAGQVIPKFEEELIGMEEGEEKEFKINPEEGYGTYREELKREIPKDALPPEQTPKEGMMLVMATPEGHQIPVKITKVSEDSVIIDLNHPLAGKKLIFKIKILEISNSKWV